MKLLTCKVVNYINFLDILICIHKYLLCKDVGSFKNDLLISCTKFKGIQMYP